MTSFLTHESWASRPVVVSFRVRLHGCPSSSARVLAPSMFMWAWRPSLCCAERLREAATASLSHWKYRTDSRSCRRVQTRQKSELICNPCQTTRSLCRRTRTLTVVATGRLCSSDGRYLDTTGIIPERQLRSNGCNAQPVTNVTFRSDVPHAPSPRVRRASRSSRRWCAWSRWT